MTYLDGRSTGILCALLDILGTVLIVGALATDGVAVVTGSDHLLPNLNALVLCTLIVESHRRIGGRTATCSGAGDEVFVSRHGVYDTVTKSAGSNTESLEVLIVSLLPSNVCRVIANIKVRSVYVLITISLDPLFDVCEECFVAIVIAVGDHVKRGVTTTLRLPQIVAPVVGTVNLVNDGSLLAVCIVKPVGTTGCENEYVLVLSLSLGFFVKHLLCFKHLAVEVGSAVRKIVDGIELFGYEINVSIGIKDRFVAVEVEDDFLTLFKREKTHSYDSLTVLHSGFENFDRRLNCFHICSHTAAEDKHDIYVTCRRSGNGQSYVGAIIIVQRSSSLVGMNQHSIV